MSDAESLYLRGNFDSAAKLWRRALPGFHLTKDSASEARTLTWLGLAAYRTGDYRASRSLGEQALSLKLRLTSPGELARSYNALGLLAWNEGRLEDASLLFARASLASRTAHDAAGLAKAANNLALVHTELGRFTEARRGFLEARSAGAELGDSRIEGGALTNLGMLDVQLGDPASAIRHLARARELYHVIGYVTGEQNALGQLGTAYHALGELGAALAVFDSALTLARDQGLRQEEASNLELMADLYRQVGDYPRALALYEEAGRINDDLGLKVEKGTNRRNAAEVQLASGRADLAGPQVAEALRIHRSSGARLQELRDRLLMADMAARGGDALTAHAELRKADALASWLGARTARVEVALARAAILERESDPAGVLTTLRLAQPDLVAGGYESEWRAAAHRSRAHAQMDQLDSAVAAGREAVAAVERVRGSLRSGLLSASLAAERLVPYADLLEVLLRSGRTEEALEVSDASRSRALLRHFAATGDPSRAVAPTLAAFAESEGLLRAIDTLVSRLDVLEEVRPGDRAGSSRDLAKNLSTQLLTARETYEALRERTAERDAGGTALLGGRTVRASEVRAAIQPGETLVEYFAGQERLVAFVVTRDTVRSLVVDVGRDELAGRVRVARDLLGRAGSGVSPQESEVLTGLHARLITPLEQAGLLRGTRRLLVVPHGALTYLPFAGLKHPGTGRYVIEDYSLLHLPSGAALAAVRARSDGLAGGHRRGYAFAPFPRQLPGTAEELEAFRRSFRDAEARQGARATESHLRDALTRGGVVHVATHGVMNTRNPMFSRISLARGGDAAADDGRLEVHELLGLRVRAPLVFLSGCETGAGGAWSTGFVRGDDYATLAQALLFAGARNVLATLWPIADRGAAVLAERFYSHLRAMPPAEALAAAQRDVMAHPEFGRPFHWAAYLLSGEGSVERRSGIAPGS
jgi:CHAT domain-containing protein/tetratricopeptide (TPR) repeat protein